ncbi:alpha-2-macroglobulin-like isoform X2 [Labeo rohita]|uniref:Alpha-2-macroglobulin-like isoform X2 n=1 Tax=Labeo rohita TaxID=84645 RepID=A0A498L6C5_LABRO|nr:alpha-2-macroglobulin-like isoform X2 [Labeo rohita]
MNRINQWINATSTHGKILQLSHTLNPEAHVGSYELLVETGKQTIKEHFQVKEYDISMEKTEKVILTYTIGRIKLINLPEFFENGSVIQAKVKAEFFNGSPFPYFKVVVQHALSQPQELTTDISGLARFTIDTSLTTSTSIYVSAQASSNNQFSTPFRFESAFKSLLIKSNEIPTKVSQLVIKAPEEPLKCEEEISVTVQYTIAGETIESGSVTIVYLVSSGEEIVHHGYKNINVKGSDGAVEGEVMFKVPVHAQMAPKMGFLTVCHPVSLQFSSTTAVPGEENTLRISAQPGSLCGLSAVDQSILILESGKHLDADKVFNMLPGRFFPYDTEYEEDCIDIRSTRSRRFLPPTFPYNPCGFNPYPSRIRGDAVYYRFRDIGLKVVTNLFIRLPTCQSMGKTCLPSPPGQPGVRGQPGPVGPMGPMGSEGLVGGAGDVGGTGTENAPLIPEETIRTFFPETWIWELVEVGDSGSAQVPVTVPDTITSWETEAFCLSSKGLGLAPPAQLTVFQPFFLELSLPYSIIRGEIFELKATVFNYLSKCIMVKVTPAPSSDYTLKASSDDQYLSCLCANGRKTFKWILTPSVLGVLNITVSAEAEASQTVCDNEIVSVPERGCIDTVTRSLRVNAEGVEKTNTHSWLLCPKGDILGRALRNLDGLLQMPYGCGEQNIAVLSPNIYILQYLENTEQLTSVTRGRAIGFLKNGSCFEQSLAKDKVTRDYLLKKLMDIGISEGSRLHWSQSGSADDFDSLAVEISSYVLLAVLTTDPVTPADLGFANRIVSWLVEQQNAYGGFSSTQDTVVALQALSLYTGTQDSSNMVIVDMKLLSGFKLEPSSLDAVQKTKVFRQTLRIKQIFSVKNLKPAVIKVYDYYQTRVEWDPAHPWKWEKLERIFMVTVPGVIRSGSEAKLCAPEANSVQEIQVEAQGENTYLIKKRKVKFLSYNPFTIIRTDKPIYNPGQTVQFRIFTVDLNFKPIDETYKLIGVQVKAEFSKGNPSPYFKVVVHHALSQPQELTTDINGLANFTIDTSLATTSSIYVLVRFSFAHGALTNQLGGPFNFRSAYKTLQIKSKESPAKASQLVIKALEEPLKCEEEISVTVQYTIAGETIESGSVTIVYLVLSREAIVHHGYKSIEVKGADGVIEGDVMFKVPVHAQMAPTMEFLAYCVLPSKIVLAASRTFQTEKCFENKVSLQFSPTTAVPGEENILQISAQPGSLCSLSAVDQSILIMESQKRLNADKVFNLLPVRLFPYEIEEQEDCIDIRSIISSMSFSSPPPPSPPYTPMQTHPYPSETGVSAAGISFTPPPTETIRTFFPETWIWELVEVGDSGSAHVPVTVPDTITSWETEAFCLSSKGLGLAPPAQLTVFQPFFLELSLPYSIIRGEIFELKATVFNYLSKCIMVKVTPAPSSDYTLKASSDDQYSSCLCANGRKTFKWILTPSVLGVLNITVSAEAEASQTVCDNEIVSVPERGRIDTVTQSLRVNVGDILGRALRNLDGLLQMPYGCGEQNIAVLSPNIYILQYLENTEQLTSAIRERATGFLKNGYQRQLNYENSDGSYTTFGNGDRNTWLTAFVLRTFGKAQRYIFIDPQKIQNSKQWLIRHQRADGSYESRGKLFNNRMKGGVSDDVTITAYITASLLELNTSVTDPAVTRGLLYLKRFVGNIQNTYTTALLVYTFSLAGDMDTRQQLFKKLEDVAISDGSHLHWSQSASAGDSDSLAVEISSYVLLAVLTTDSVTPADLGFANRIVSWLVKQQNAYGGFSSTQDTVVALQALSLYATKVFSSDGSSTVTVQSAGDTHHFDVNQDNKLLYQEKQLQNFSAKYSIEVKGSTCVSVQMSLFYNIPTPKESKALRIIVRTGGVCQRRTEQILDIVLDVIYTGTQDSSNMVIVDMKLLSGFQLEPSSVDALKKSVHRVEFKDDHVIMYLQEIQKYILFRQTLRIKQIFSVKNLKPAVIKAYDYYQTSERTEAEYFNHCA